MRQTERVAALPARKTPARKTLLDVVDGIDPAARARGMAIFAEQPWGPGSPAVVLDEQAHRGCSLTMPTYAYLLEVERAAEVLRVWSAARYGAVPSPEEAAEALVHYAAHAAHLPATCAQSGCGRPGPQACSRCGRSTCATHLAGLRGQQECRSCAPIRPTRPTPEASRPRAPVALAILGVLGIILGLVLSSSALVVGGACLLLVGGCIWLSAFVLRMMR